MDLKKCPRGHGVMKITEKGFECGLCGYIEKNIMVSNVKHKNLNKDDKEKE